MNVKSCAHLKSNEVVRDRILFAVIVVCIGGAWLTAFAAYFYPYSGFALKQSIERGKRVVEALETFHADTGEYPATLTELTPKYLNEIPQPTWGLGVWKYQRESEFFDLGVDETTYTGDGNSMWLRYMGKKFGWQTGD